MPDSLSEHDVYELGAWSVTTLLSDLLPTYEVDRFGAWGVCLEWVDVQQQHMWKTVGTRYSMVVRAMSYRFLQPCVLFVEGVSAVIAYSIISRISLAPEQPISDVEFLAGHAILRCHTDTFGGAAMQRVPPKIVFYA